MKAIIETGGKQYAVEEGTEIFVEKLEGNAGDKVTFDKVLMLDGKVGRPYVSGAKRPDFTLVLLSVLVMGNSTVPDCDVAVESPFMFSNSN